MIPLRYSLRDGVRLEDRAGEILLTCSLPQTTLKINRAALRIIRGCDGSRDVSSLATEERWDEETVVRVCEQLRRRGLLTLSGLSPAPEFPSVSVIIPVKDGERTLAECLDSVFAQSYPSYRFEVIVVDDGSRDRTAEIASHMGCRVISCAVNRGQSWARNRAGAEAGGEILAFIDADCVADPGWLAELTPLFAWERVGAVGGRVEGYYLSTALDRYEHTFSSLSVGREPMLEGPGPSTFYVPTCNMLVRRSVYQELGGLREEMRVGEDVDFCWRLRKSGRLLVFAPWGGVRHKHRAHMGSMIRRKAAYGGSEALLHRLHPEKRKSLPLPPLAAGASTGLLASLASAHLWPLVPALGALAVDAGRRAGSSRRAGGRREPAAALAGTVRRHLSLAYFLSFHLTRYYLLLLLVLGLWKRSAWRLAGAALLLSAAVDYATKKPDLDPLRFLGLYALEHAGYQVGVARGALRERSLRLYALRCGSVGGLASSRTTPKSSVVSKCAAAPSPLGPKPRAS